MEVQMKKGLLDTLALQLGCFYLSDLKSELNAGNLKLRKFIEEIEPDAYSDNEWVEAVSYLTGEKCKLEDADSCKCLLLGFF